MVPVAGRPVSHRGGRTPRPRGRPGALPEGVARGGRRRSIECRGRARCGGGRVRDGTARQRHPRACRPGPDDEAGARGLSPQGLRDGHPAADAPGGATGVPAARRGPRIARAGARAQRAIGACRGGVRGVPEALPARRGGRPDPQAPARAHVCDQSGQRARPCGRGRGVPLEAVRRRLPGVPARPERLRRWHALEQPHHPGRAAERRGTLCAAARRPFRRRQSGERGLRPRPARGRAWRPSRGSR